MEAGYEPDGWLAEFCRGREIYDLSEKNVDEWNRIFGKLKELNRPDNDGTVSGSHCHARSCKCQDWSFTLNFLFKRLTLL